MNCPRCKADNPKGLRFCGHCGMPFAANCPACGSETPGQFKFCGNCGQPLARADVAQALLPVQPAQPGSFVNGRYTVTRFLGEGGKKRVYLAHDTLLDRDIAFALIKTEGRVLWTS